MVGWLKTKTFLETGDAAKSQGWTPIIVDTNGNGKRDEFVGPNDPLDPAKDKRVMAGFYGVMPSTVDDSVWGQTMGSGFARIDQPGYIIRLVPGAESGGDGARRALSCRPMAPGARAAST